MEKLTDFEESFPSMESLSQLNTFLCTASDLSLKNNLIPENAEKFLQKIKIPLDLRTGILILKNHLYHLKSEGHDPALSTDLFGPPDISFPFNYFW